MSTPPPDDLLDRALLRQLAGDAEFRKGESYFQNGAVRQVQVASDRITAKVSGSRAYRVKLWRGRGQLQFSCNCDRGHEQEFCSHCVAVGLAWIAGPDGQTAKPGVTRDALRDHLRGLDKDRLINLALEAMDYDDILRRRLMLETIGLLRPRKGEPAQPPDLVTYRQILREAIECADYVDYEAMPDYTQGVEEAIRPLGELLRGGHAAAVVDLAEFALVELDKANDMLDGGDGSLNAVYDDLQQYHLEACRLAELDPEKLAARLLEYEIEGGLGVFNNTVGAYADVLGENGLRAWRRQLTQAWRDLPPSGSGRTDEIDHRRFQINALMERMAGDAGDLDALAAIRQRDLTSAHDYLALAETYREAGRLDQAIATAEQGLAAGSRDADLSDLRDFLSSAYLQAQRPAEAARLAWQQFEETPDLEVFDQLKTAAAADWPAWRDRAISLLRQRALPGDRSALVEALLSEGLIEEAWDEAKAGGVRVRLWLDLAERRAATSPGDALRIYQDQLNAIIAGGDQRAYRQAIDVLAKIRRLLETLGRREDFGAISAEVRAAHRQKRNFLKLLDGMR